MTPITRYLSPDEDSGRWAGFPFRDDDIVISARSKSGTTWIQMICALLIFGGPELPAPLGELSPWLDWLVEPREKLFARLAAQGHHRFIKTHTPLDGIVIDPNVSYIVVARNPLDMAVSLYHQGDNIDRRQVAELTGHPIGDRGRRPPIQEWLQSWTEREASPREEMDSLDGVLHHYADAWSRRCQHNVLLVHYDDLLDDLGGEMKRIGGWLGIDTPAEGWPQLVAAARFEEMRRNHDRLVPDRVGVLRDRAAFFRSGVSGRGRAELTEEAYHTYRTRVAATMPPGLDTWLHGGSGAQGPGLTPSRSG